MSEILNRAGINAVLGAGSVVLNDYALNITPIERGYRLTVKRGSDTQTIDILDGVGIVGIEKTGSTGDVDSYRITFTDGSTFDYTVETNAAAHAAAESARVEAENSRDSAEAARESAEAGRVNAEDARVAAEAVRESAETARASAESARAQAENGRQSVEAARVTAEQSRASAESVRMAAENARVAADTVRANAENGRAGAETLRAAAETDRSTAESGRVNAEQGRVSAESERVAAEKARAEEFAGFSGEINELKDDISTLEKSVLAEKKLSIKLNKGAYEKALITGTNKWAYCVIDRLGYTEISVPTGYRFSIYTYGNGDGGTQIYSTRTTRMVFTSTEKYVVNFGRTDATNLTESDYETIKQNAIINVKNDNSLESKISTYDISNVFNQPLYYDEAITRERLVGEDGSRTVSQYGATTSLITIHAPICLFIPSEFMACVNLYSNRFSWNNFVKNIIPYTDTREIVVSCESYPSVVGIGIKRVDGGQVTASDVVNILKDFTIKTIMPKPLYASFSMFKDFAVVGCSWDAGTCYSSTAPAVSRTGLGWAENIGRRNGCNVHNYAIGGASLRNWFNFADEQDEYGKMGMKGLLADDAQPLYILLSGNVNDAAVSQTVNRGFIRNDDTTEYPFDKVYRVGSIDDLSDADYHNYPTTYYGYYGRVVEMILEHAPNACIIVTSPDTNISSNEIYRDFEIANKEIAEHYGLPFIDLTDDPYYYVYLSKLRGNHPLALTYSGFAMQMERQFAKCVEENETYFERYNNVNTTVSVAWEEVN